MSFAVSNAQRGKVRGQACAYCGFDGGVDPAHVWPRSLGGCAHPDCVLPICRDCHRKYDEGQLDLLWTVRNYWPKEYQHAIDHAGTQARADRRIANVPNTPAPRRFRNSGQTGA